MGVATLALQLAPLGAFFGGFFFAIWVCYRLGAATYQINLPPSE